MQGERVAAHEHELDSAVGEQAQDVLEVLVEAVEAHSSSGRGSPGRKSRAGTAVRS